MPIDCYFCGKQLKWRKRSDSVYCDDDCKTKHNNMRRKLNAQRMKIHKALDVIESISKQNRHLTDIAFDSVISIKGRVDRMNFGSRYKCTDCGQMTYLEPYDWMSCPFCGMSQERGFEVVMDVDLP